MIAVFLIILQQTSAVTGMRMYKRCDRGSAIGKLMLLHTTGRVINMPDDGGNETHYLSNSRFKFISHVLQRYKRHISYSTEY